MHVIAIDLDGTALLHPGQVKKYFENKNNFIVIYTARSESMRDTTIQELREKRIPYHALVMEKLRADVYIDDKNAGGLVWPEF